MSDDLFNRQVLRALVLDCVREVLAEEHPVTTELLTVPEAAALAKVKPATIRTWIADGKLAASRVGRRHRIRRADLDALAHDDQPPRPHRRRRVIAEAIELRARREAQKVLGPATSSSPRQ
jgi:excisionase family DNA binding protein